MCEVSYLLIFLCVYFLILVRPSGLFVTFVTSLKLQVFCRYVFCALFQVKCQVQEDHDSWFAVEFLLRAGWSFNNTAPGLQQERCFSCKEDTEDPGAHDSGKTCTLPCITVMLKFQDLM